MSITLQKYNIGLPEEFWDQGRGEVLFVDDAYDVISRYSLQLGTFLLKQYQLELMGVTVKINRPVYYTCKFYLLILQVWAFCSLRSNMPRYFGVTVLYHSSSVHMGNRVVEEELNINLSSEDHS